MIDSVLGPIEPASLGPTDCHDHLFIQPCHTTRLEPEFLLDDVGAATAEAEAVLAAGGSAVLDCTPIGAGRDAEGLVEVATRTGLTVLGVTGFHRDAFYDEDHWARACDTDTLTALVVSEAVEGMGRSPYDRPDDDRSSARPAAIKVAVSGERPTGFEAMLVDAVGAAAAATGLPVITHTETVAGARLQLDVLAAHGVTPDRVVLSHMDRHSTVAELVDVCASGASVCLDWAGRTDRGSDDRIVALATGLVEAGCGDRLVLGQDLARRQYWQAYGGGPGFAHLFTAILPQLRAAGLAERDVHTIMVDTPRRVLTPRNGAMS